jgi:hypothetical protein
MLLELPDDLLGLVLDATDEPLGLRLASKRFASMPRGKARIREWQRRVLRRWSIMECHHTEAYLRSDLAGHLYLGYVLHYGLANLSRAAGDLTAKVLVAAANDWFLRRTFTAHLAGPFFSFTPIEVGLIRDQLVAQRLLLHDELIEGCRAWILETGKDGTEDLDVDEVQAYVQNKMKVPEGSPSPAKRLISQAYDKAWNTPGRGRPPQVPIGDLW